MIELFGRFRTIVIETMLFHVFDVCSDNRILAWVTIRSISVVKLRIVIIFVTVFAGSVFAPCSEQDEADSRWLQWVQRVESDDLEVRRSASEKLFEFATLIDQGAAQRIADALKKEKDAQVRLHLFELARLMKETGEPFVPVLVEFLQKENRGRGNEILHQEHRAAIALASIGDASLPGLLELLESKKTSIKLEACMAIGKIGPHALSAYSKLRELLTDDNERLRIEAAMAMMSIGNDATKTLIEIAESGSPRERDCALRAIGSKISSDARISTAIQKALVSDEALIRVAALNALVHADLDRNTIRDAVLDNLLHDDKAVRHAAVNYLNQVGTSQLMEWKTQLTALLRHPNEEIVGDIAFVLRFLGSSVATPMTDRFAYSERPNERLVSALALMGTAAVPTLMQRSKDENPKIRAGCALALGQIRPLQSAIVDQLTHMIEDESVDVRLATITALGRLGPRAKSAVGAVEQNLRNSSAALRCAAVESFFLLSDRNESAARKVMPLLSDEDDNVKLGTLQVLQSLGSAGRPAIDEVAKLLEDQTQAIQLRSVAFLGSHGKAASRSASSMLRLLSHSDTTGSLKLQVLQTLARFGSDAAPSYERVREMFLSESELPIKLAALEAVTSFEIPFKNTQTLLKDALRSEHEELRKNALRSMRKFGEDSRGLLVEVIELLKPDEKDDSYVMRELQRQEKYGVDKECIPGLVKLLSASNPKQIGAAIRFLKGIPFDESPGTRDALSQLQNHSDPQIRRAADEALKPSSPN